MTWVYIQSEPGLWTVGFYDPSGHWNPDSDYSCREAAAKRCRWLNGGREAEEDDGGSYAEYLYRYHYDKYVEKYGERGY